jgi:hypothetical protein
MTGTRKHSHSNCVGTCTQTDGNGHSNCVGTCTQTDGNSHSNCVGTCTQTQGHTATATVWGHALKHRDTPPQQLCGDMHSNTRTHRHSNCVGTCTQNTGTHRHSNCVGTCTQTQGNTHVNTRRVRGAQTGNDLTPELFLPVSVDVTTQEEAIA